MLEQIIPHIQGANLLGLVLGYSTMGMGAIVSGALLYPTVSKWLLPQYKEEKLWQYLKFHSVLKDGATIRLRDGSLVVTILVPGKCEGGMDKSERKELFSRRKVLFDSFSKEFPNIGIRVISRRSRTVLDLDYDSGHPVRNAIMQRWNAQFTQSFSNFHYVVLTVKGDTDAARTSLDKATERTLTMLAKFGASRLTHGSGRHSDLLTFWARMVNPANTHPIGKFRDQISRRLYGGPVDIDLDTGLIRFSAGAGRDLHAYMVVVPTWGEESAEEVVSRILSVQGELLVAHRIKVWDPSTAEMTISKRGDWASSLSFSRSVDEQFELAQDMLAEGAQNPQALVNYEMVVVAYGETPEDALEVAKAVESKLVDVGARPHIDVDLAQPLYFGLFPGFDEMIRDCSLFSQNVAEFVTFETAPVGVMRTNWGDGPALMTKTDQGTPYYLNLQIGDGPEDAGHFVIIGNIGGGKTVLATLVGTGVLRHKDLRLFGFDADRGMLTWTLLTGGRYIGLGADIPGCMTASLQPFQQDLTDENKMHMRQFLRMLTGLTDADSERYYSDAVQVTESLSFEDRTLSNIVNASFPKDSKAYEQIYKWLDPAQYGAVFNGPPENMPIDDDDCRHFIFDMTALLKDDVLAPVVVFEVMHRIDAMARKHGCPVLVLIDEAAFMLKNPQFRKEFLEWVARMRKRRIVVGIILQRPDQLDEIDPSLSSAVRQLMPTWLILPNANADLSKYKDWPLTDREKHFIKGRLAQTAHMQYPVLVKKTTVGESAFIETVNDCLGEYKQIFRSGETFWRLALSCLKSNSENPVEQYLDEADRLARREP